MIENSQQTSIILEIHTIIMDSPASGPFLAPVDEVVDEAPDYYSVVADPMDLTAILSKIQTGQYQNAWEYREDFQKVVSNSRLFNTRKV
jgi:hypothetical protein